MCHFFNFLALRKPSEGKKRQEDGYKCWPGTGAQRGNLMLALTKPLRRGGRTPHSQASKRFTKDYIY